VANPRAVSGNPIVSAGLKEQHFRRFCGCRREAKRKTTTTTANLSSGAKPDWRARLLFGFLESVNDQTIGDPPRRQQEQEQWKTEPAWRPA
jgi:hypothetical protein